jgi:UDP-glucuronate 4-epimerase
MRVLITGAAGFIGFHTVKKLLAQADIEIVALDNINDYYAKQLKFDRLKELGFETIKEDELLTSDKYPCLRFIQFSLAEQHKLKALFQQHSFDYIISLGAQAGVRYSIENPESYISSNITGFFNLLECCRQYPVKHLIYASSSSVYGLSKKSTFETDDRTDHPISLYAATKKSNELMAYTYHHLFKIPVTGLRFFTVYGPWGRPDMAYFSFTKNILEGKEINIFNNGDLMRDFTYIDDIVGGITKLLNAVKESPEKFGYNIYNLGNNQPVKLMDFIVTLENLLNRKAVKKYLPMQPGDVLSTYADISTSARDFNYTASININEGLSKFIDWYKMYYKI